jgi:hypothetical protein
MKDEVNEVKKAKQNIDHQKKPSGNTIIHIKPHLNITNGPLDNGAYRHERNGLT